MIRKRTILLIFNVLLLLLTSILKINQSLVRLPRIGGIGTLLFIIIGILMIGEAIQYKIAIKTKKDS